MLNKSIHFYYLFNEGLASPHPSIVRKKSYRTLKNFAMEFFDFSFFKQYLKDIFFEKMDIQSEFTMEGLSSSSAILILVFIAINALIILKASKKKEEEEEEEWNP